VRIERKVGVTVAGLGALLIAMGGAAPAIAGSGPAAGLGHFTGAKLTITNATSTGFGGWVFTPKGAKSVTAEYKVPSFKCTSVASGFGPLSALATSTAASGFNAAGLLMGCSGGSAVASAAVVVNGVQTLGTKPVAAGDLIKTTITVTTTKVTATVADLTKARAFTLTKSGKGGVGLEELIVDDSLNNGTTQLPVTNFGKLAFSKAAVSGKAIGGVKPQTAVNMETAKKVLQILTGPITGTAKNTFLTTWKHS
jgi:Peptidase A4 family